MRKSASWIGPSPVTFQEGSVMTASVEPSAYSISSWALNTGLESRKLTYCAFQSSGLSKPIVHLAGALHSEAWPASSQTFTLQKQTCREESGLPLYSIFAVRSLVTLRLSHKASPGFVRGFA